METYNERDTIKLTVQEAREVQWGEGEGLPWKEHVTRLANEVVEIEGQIGDSHEELYGFSWKDYLTE